MTTHQVHIKNMAYNPPTLAIAVGDEVEWIADDPNHSVTADNRLWDSGVIKKGGKFTRTFDATGVYTYHCLVHGEGMAGVVNVDVAGMDLQDIEEYLLSVAATIDLDKKNIKLVDTANNLLGEVKRLRKEIKDLRAKIDWMTES